MTDPVMWYQIIDRTKLSEGDSNCCGFSVYIDLHAVNEYEIDKRRVETLLRHVGFYEPNFFNISVEWPDDNHMSLFESLRLVNGLDEAELFYDGEARDAEGLTNRYVVYNTKRCHTPLLRHGLELALSQWAKEVDRVHDR
ncbi:MAG: hypothetical protein ABIH37_00740 [archaeon]